MAERNRVDREDRGREAYCAQQRGLRTSVRAMINPGLIAEHADAPLGRHSDALERVLRFLARASTEKFVIIRAKPDAVWQLAKLRGRRGRYPEMIADARYESEAEALHAVFERQIAELMEVDN